MIPAQLGLAERVAAAFAATPRADFLPPGERGLADFDGALKDLADMLQAKPVPIQLPIGSAESFKGAVDLLSMKALIYQPNGQVKEEAIPADLADDAKAARERLMEAVADLLHHRLRKR